MCFIRVSRFYSAVIVHTWGRRPIPVIRLTTWSATYTFTQGTTPRQVCTLALPCDSDVMGLSFSRDRSLVMTRGERGQMTFYGKYFRALHGARRKKIRMKKFQCLLL